MGWYMNVLMACLTVGILCSVHVCAVSINGQMQNLINEPVMMDSGSSLAEP